jgi:exonuclease SbcC
MEEQQRRKEEVFRLEKEAQKLDAQFKEKKNSLERARSLLEAKVENCEAQVAKLSDAHCVDLEAARLNPCAFLKGAMEAAERLPRLKEDIRNLCDPEIVTIQEKSQQIRDEIGCVHYDADRLEALVRRCRELEPLVEKAAGLESKQEMVEILEGQQRAAQEKILELTKHLEEIRREGEELKARLESLPTLKSRIETLQPWRDRQEQLPVAKERFRGISEQIVGLTKEAEQAEDEQDRLVVKLHEVQAEANPEAVEREAARIREELKGLRSILQELHSTSGAVNARLEELAQAEGERKALTAERKPIATDLTQYQTLTKAFGRDGIPALIIENAVPELERISNEILGEMSQGRHSLRFETQRELKSRVGVAETLDIIVSDWQGSRPYETFSGGEQLRIDFAIRFALAELLARRAGSRIEWLVVDEGLGSQDREHRELVLEAIRNVANRFRKVLVITHVEEAQGAFPQQIVFDVSGDEVNVEVA